MRRKGEEDCLVKKKKGRHTFTVTARWPPPLESLCTSSARTREREKERLNHTDVNSVYVYVMFFLFLRGKGRRKRMVDWPTSGATWTASDRSSLIINRPFWMISLSRILAIVLFSLQDWKPYRTENYRSIKSSLLLEPCSRISIRASCFQPLCALLWRNRLPERNLVQHEWRTSLGRKDSHCFRCKDNREERLTSFSAHVAHVCAVETIAQFDDRFIICRSEKKGKEWRSRERRPISITDVSAFRDGCGVNLQDVQTRLFVGKWDFYPQQWIGTDTMTSCCSYQSFCPIDRDASRLDPVYQDDWWPWWFSPCPRYRSRPSDWEAKEDRERTSCLYC